MKLDQARCSSIYRIRSRQSWLQLANSQHAIRKAHRLDSHTLLVSEFIFFKSWKNFLIVKLMDEFAVSCCQRNPVFSDPQFGGHIPNQRSVLRLRRAKDVVSPCGKVHR